MERVGKHVSTSDLEGVGCQANEDANCSGRAAHAQSSGRRQSSLWLTVEFSSKMESNTRDFRFSQRW